MNLTALELLHAEHRQDLETRLRNSESNIKNLNRMLQQCFDTLEKRYNEDKESFSSIFTTLVTNEISTRQVLETELGVMGLMRADPTQLDSEETVEIRKKKRST